MLTDHDPRPSRRRRLGGGLRTEPDATAARRRISPARALPNGRAALGGLLVAVAALGTYLLATGGSKGPSTQYAVAAHDLAPGETLSADDVRLVGLDLPPDQARGTFTSTAPLQGAVARGPLQAGAVVTAAAVEQPGVADAGTSYRELSVTLPTDRAVGGTLRPGDRVDVVATANGTTHVLVQRVTVLAVGGGRSSNPLTSGDITITLALPDATSALAVAHGAAAAQLTLLRSSRASSPLPDSFRLPAPSSTAATGGTGSAGGGGTASTATGATGGSGTTGTTAQAGSRS